MSEMAKFPYLTGRKGTRNLYYKRLVPLALRAEGRPEQIWRSLKTADRKAAEKAYAAQHAEVEQLFDRWLKEDRQPIGRVEPDERAPSKTTKANTSLTPTLLRRLTDTHYLNVYDRDFQRRGDLWRQAQQNEDAFWAGEIIGHPINDWHSYKGQEYSYYAYLMEEPSLEDVFLYCVFVDRKKRLHDLRKRYQLGSIEELEAAANELLQNEQVELSSTDIARLVRKLMEVEIRVLADLTAEDETSFDGILDRQATAEATAQSVTASTPGEPMSCLMETYLDQTARTSEWPTKTVLRKRGELREFLEISGDKPVNAYTQADGVRFRDTQLALPANRQRQPFKGLALVDAAKAASQLRDKGEQVQILNAITVNDKIGTVAVFFNWAKARDTSVTNPVTGLGIRRPKARGKKKRHPWSIDELNRMFAAPLYTGCQSERRWAQPGEHILNRSAKFWVPLIALYSGMRLGEIIQLQVSDIKTVNDIDYFDVSPLAADPNDEEGEDFDENEKSLKTESSRRGVPIHQVLFDLGFREFLDYRRRSKQIRLFPEYEKAKDDGSWSKQFSKHFTRFRESVGVTRRGVKFHSFRHNVEDALRNADVRQDVRDAVQGHGENGVSREYGSGFYITTLNDAVQRISYYGLQLPKDSKSSAAH